MDPIAYVREHRLLIAQVLDEDLLEDEPPCRAVPEGEPDEEGNGPGPPVEPGRLRIEVERPRWIALGQRRIEREEREEP
jgi:hypothetical protein